MITGGLEVKSRENLTASVEDIKAKRWNAAIGRGYYAAFQKVLAILPSGTPKEIGRGSHIRTIHTARLMIAKTHGNILAAFVAENLAELRRLRNQSDYSQDLMDERTATNAIALVEEIISTLNLRP